MRITVQFAFVALAAFASTQQPVSLGFNYPETGPYASLDSCRSLGELTAEQFVGRATDHLDRCRGLFAQWAAEDVFGMALEFQTLDELQDHVGDLIRGGSSCERNGAQ